MAVARSSPRLAWRRVSWRVLQALALSVVFATALVVGAVVHLDLPASRRLVARSLNALFADLFLGRVEILAFDRLELGQVRVPSARVLAPDGTEVLRAERLLVRSDWWQEIMAWALGLRDARLVVDRTRVDRVEVSLAATEDGKLALAEAFSLRETERPPREPAARPTVPKLLALEWPSIEIGHVKVTGTLPDGPSLAGELRRIHAALRVDSQGSVRLDVSRAGVREEGLLGQTVAGSAAFHLRVPELRMWGDFAGDLAGLQVVAVAKLADARLDAIVELPRVAPGALDPWLPGLPIRYPFVGRLAIGGALPKLAIAAQLGFPKLPDGLARGSITADGLLTLDGRPLLDLGVKAERVDTRMFSDEPVWATIDAAARMVVRLAGDDSELRVLFEAAGPTSLGESLPSTGGTVVLDGDRVATFLRLAEPGSPADLFVQYDSTGEVRAGVELDVARLDRRSRIGEGLASLLGSDAFSGKARVRARAAWKDDQLEADFGAELRSVGWPESGMRLAAIDLGGRLSGPVDELALDAHAAGHDFAVAGRELERFRIAARGPLREPTVFLSATDQERREIEAQAVVTPLTGAARQVALRVDRDGTPLQARIAAIRPDGGGLAVDGVEIDGLGADGLRGRLAVAGDELEGSLRGTGLELEPLRKLLGVPFPVRGKADVDVELRGTGSGRKGHVKLALHDAGMLVIDGVQAKLEVAVDGAQVRTDAKVEMTAAAAGPAPDGARPDDPCAGTFAAVEIVGALARLDGPLLSSATYERATGTFPVRLPAIRLSCVGQTLAQVFYSGSQAPLSELDGRLDAAFDITREPGLRWPSIRGLRLATSGLRVVAQPPKPDAPPPWSSTELDFDLQGSVEARTEQAKFALIVRDQEKLLDLAVAVRVPYERLLAGDFAGAWDAIRQAPASIELEVPRRALSSLASLPDPVGAKLPPVRGEAQLLASLDGSLGDPAVTVRLRGWGLGPSPNAAAASGRMTGWSLPLDVDAVATYARRVAGLETTFTAGGRRLARLKAGMQADLPASLWAKRWPPEGWSGSVGLELDRLPLDALGALAAHDIDGTLSGSVTVAELGRAPQLTADLQTSGLRFGPSSVLESARVTVRPVPDSTDGTVVIDGELRAVRAGRLGFTAYGGVRWEEGWSPAVDEKAPADLLVRAERLPLDPFLPLVSPAVSKLEGRLDGDLRLQWQQVAAASDAELSIDMKLTEGVLHVPEIGQELRGVAGHLTSDAGGIVRIDDIAAQATSGRLTGEARVRLDGFDVRDLTGEIVVAEGEEIPATFEGVPLGMASGRFIVHAVKQPTEVELNLTAQNLRLTLPAGSSQSVQPLQDNPEIAVSHLLDKPATSRQAGDLRWNVTLGLLDSEVRGSGIRLAFSSNPLLPPTVKVDSTVEVGGELVLASGEFDFLGLGSGLKPFVLDRGVVRLRSEDPSNPYVNVAAHYDAPDGSIITLEYVGLFKPITREKIRFRSTPPRTEQEIITLLLFGETSSSSSASAGTTGTRDAAAAGGGSIAAYQLNALLGGIAPLQGLSTTFGVTEEGYTSTGVTYQISDTVSAQAAYERREQSTNTGTVDTTTEGRSADSLSRTRIGVDWRFYQDFLLRGSIGIGDEPTSGLDLMWQYRY